MNEVKGELGRGFPRKGLGPAHFFLGMQIIRKAQERKMTLCQDRYIESVLKPFRLHDYYKVSTPIEPGLQLISQEPTIEDSTLYWSLLGRVMYLMLYTRPDLAYAVGALSKFTSNPRQQHINAVKRLLQYVHKTQAQGLHFRPFIQDCTPVAMFSGMLIGLVTAITVEALEHICVPYPTSNRTPSILWSHGRASSRQRSHSHVRSLSTWHSRKHVRKRSGCRGLCKN